MRILPNDIHIWHINLTSLPPFEAALKVMSDDEQARANKITNKVIKNHFCLTRLAMRRILAGYLQTDAKNLAIYKTALGKPKLVEDHYPVDLRFNLSHTKGYAALAVTLGREIGIDIEHKERQVKVMPLARRYFAEPTLAALEALTGDQQRLAFLGLWTRYEAYKKARGDGLRGESQKLDFPLETSEEGSFEPVGNEGDKYSWQVSTITSNGNHISAIATESEQDLKIIHLDWF